MYVQLLLNDHDPDIDLWSWGGEPIYRNGKCCGQTTTTGYGYTFKKQVCLGFIKNIDNNGKYQRVTNEYVLSGDYEVEIAGIRYLIFHNHYVLIINLMFNGFYTYSI